MGHVFPAGSIRGTKKSLFSKEQLLGTDNVLKTVFF